MAAHEEVCRRRTLNGSRKACAGVDPVLGGAVASNTWTWRVTQTVISAPDPLTKEDLAVHLQLPTLPRSELPLVPLGMALP